MSYLRTAILLAGLTALFMGVGYLIGGPKRRPDRLPVRRGMNFFAYWNSDRMVLSMHGAQEVDDALGARTHSHRAELVATRRAADAACLSHGQPAAERVRDRAKPRACRGRRHDRPAAVCSRATRWPASSPTSSPMSRIATPC